MPGRDAATVRELLAQAPPGELRNVASDVRALLGDEQVQTPLSFLRAPPKRPGARLNP